VSVFIQYLRGLLTFLLVRMSVRIYRAKLAEQCTREYGWSLSQSNKYVKEFCDKFLPVKRFLKDFEGTLCRPPPILSMVWDIAVTFGKEYAILCGKQLIERSLDGMQEGSYERAIEAYQELFGDQPNMNIWKAPLGDDKENVSEIDVKTDEEETGCYPRKRRNVICSSESSDTFSEDEEEEEPEEEPEEVIHQSSNYKHYTKKELAAIDKSLAAKPKMFHVHLESAMTGKIITLHASLEHTKEEIGRLIMLLKEYRSRLVYAGKQIKAGCKLGEYRVEDGATINMKLRMCGC
jgi:hypothetical protein